MEMILETDRLEIKKFFKRITTVHFAQKFEI